MSSSSVTLYVLIGHCALSTMVLLHNLRSASITLRVFTDSSLSSSSHHHHQLRFPSFLDIAFSLLWFFSTICDLLLSHWGYLLTRLWVLVVIIIISYAFPPSWTLPSLYYGSSPQFAISASITLRVFTDSSLSSSGLHHQLRFTSFLDIALSLLWFFSTICDLLLLHWGYLLTGVHIRGVWGVYHPAQ